MKFKPFLGAASLGLLLLGSAGAAQAHGWHDGGWGWGGPHVVIGFGGPAYYAPPPPVYYAPPPPVYYAPPPAYYAPPPSYYYPGY